MLVSHKNEFIYIKAAKVAGTSVQAALAKECGPADVITPIPEQAFLQWYKPNPKGFLTHERPAEIKRKIGQSIWESYKKVVVIRNPWDTAVSKYRHVCFGASKVEESRRFIKEYPTIERWLLSGKQEFNNDVFCFWPDGKFVADLHIKFENLRRDYERVCRVLQVKTHRLPRLKMMKKAPKEHYSMYFSERAAQIVEEKCQQQVRSFGYKFEREAPYSPEILSACSREFYTIPIER